MHTPILKMHWERFTAHVDLDHATATILVLPYTKAPIDQLVLLSEGCANTNYKVTFKNNRAPVVIRIYLREQSALMLELALHKLVANQVPVSAYLYADAQCNNFPHPYAIVEWIDGKLLREIILNKNESAINDCAFEAGQYINTLRKIKFSQGGFFEEDLKIRPFTPQEEYLPFVLNLLQDSIVKDSLGASLVSAVTHLVENSAHLLPEEDEATLTHGDFDPANILVIQKGDKWQISAILDWEFAYAGTYLLDMGLMLRYSHKLPENYENSFIAGIQDSGFRLPLEWKKQAKLMDLLCLLQLTQFNPITTRPKLNRDVVSLIAHIVNNWHQF